MSLPAIHSKTTIKELPVEMFIAIASYLDNTSLATSTKVCAYWRKNLDDLLVRHRENGYCAQELGYHPELVRALHSRNLSLWRLPLLDLKGRMGSSDYIDFLKNGDVTGSPIMRFTDKLGRVGLAIRFRGNIDGERFFGSDGNASPIREAVCVLAIFKRYTNGNRWEIGGSESVIVEIYRHYRGGRELVTNPMPKKHRKNPAGWVADIIKTTNSLPVKIDGKIEQVEGVALPGYSLRQPVVAPLAPVAVAVLPTKK